jgi:hypothetical protein
MEGEQQLYLHARSSSRITFRFHSKHREFVAQGRLALLSSRGDGCASVVVATAHACGVVGCCSAGAYRRAGGAPGGPGGSGAGVCGAGGSCCFRSSHAFH